VEEGVAVALMAFAGEACDACERVRRSRSMRRGRISRERRWASRRPGEKALVEEGECGLDVVRI